MLTLKHDLCSWFLQLSKLGESFHLLVLKFCIKITVIVQIRNLFRMMLARSIALPTPAVMDGQMPQFYNNRIMMPMNESGNPLLDVLLNQRSIPVSVNQGQSISRQQMDCSYMTGPSSAALTSQLLVELQHRYAVTAAMMARQQASQLGTLPPVFTPLVFHQEAKPAIMQSSPYILPSLSIPGDSDSALRMLEKVAAFNHQPLPIHHLNPTEVSGKRNRDTIESMCESYLPSRTLSEGTSATLPLSRSASQATTESRTPSAAHSETSSKKRRLDSGRDDLDDNEESSGAEEERRTGGAGKRSATIRWTRAEHEQFLEGLERFGVGQWCSIARHCVPSRSPAQVASHHQKFAIRSNLPPERRHKASLLDLTTPKVQTLVAAQRASEA